MVFSSLLFLFFFLPIFLGIYTFVPKKFKNLVLFLSSLLFYAWGEPIYVSIMIFSTVVDYTIGRLIDRYRQSPKIAKMALMGSVIINLSLLGFFKYSNFFLANLNHWFGSDWALLQIALPIGISFYTFQTMSYTIDLYRGKIAVQKNFIAFGAYVAMFPQLIAGPIVTYQTVAKSINHRVQTTDDFGEGIGRFIQGLGKKVLIANNIGVLWESIKLMPADQLSTTAAWLGMLAFGLQLYFDFSGYSDMAIGLGRMLGFQFPENFNYPYIAKSVTEFWRRWHMTLGAWFREYVYIPLGGNRVSPLRHCVNLLLVWFLTGFWHGAGWNFIFWGIYFGILIIVEKQWLLKWLARRPAFVGHGYLILVILISWVFFSLESLSSIQLYLQAMVGLGSGGWIDEQTLYLIKNFAVLLIAGVMLATPYLKQLVVKLPSWIQAMILLSILFLSTAYLVDATYNPFLYFRF